MRCKLMERAIEIFCIIAMLLFSSSVSGFDRITGRMWSSRSEVVATEGMVCAAHPLAVQVGIDILKKGGSAVDAAIAVNAVLGLMEPVSCGVGGDLFAIVWDSKTEKLYGLNASGRAPYLLTIEEVKKAGYERIPLTGVFPQTVPGCVDGWFELHRRFGRLSMKEVLAPAIKYAREGFPVTDKIHPCLFLRELMSYSQEKAGMYFIEVRLQGQLMHSRKESGAI